MLVPLVVRRAGRRSADPLDHRRPAPRRRARGRASAALASRIACSLLLAASAGHAAATRAQEAAAPAGSAAADTALDVGAFDGGVLDTIVVTAAAIRAGAALPASPVVTTIVQLDDARGGGDLAERLAAVAGLQLRRYGGPGSPALPSLRGSTAPQVQVLVDGLPLADAQSGVVDLASLPLERYAAAEVHRGLAPAGLGAAGAAGAINLVSRDVADAAGEVRLFAGSFGDVGGRASFSAASRGGARRGLLLVHGRRADHRFGYLDHRQTFATADDDTMRRRRNAQLAEFGLYAVGELAGGRGSLRASGGFFRQDAGRPGPLNDPSPRATARRDRWDARLTAADAARRFGLDLAAGRRDEALHDADAEVGFDPPGTTRARSDQLSGRVTWSPTWRTLDDDGAPAVELALLAGGGWLGEWYDESHAGDARPRRERTTVSAFSSLTARWAAARLQVAPGWRWQRIRDDFPPVPAMPWLPEGEPVVHTQEAVSPSVGAAWQAVPGLVTLEGHWHESVRPPTWVELFGQPGGLEGNRELVPEAVTGRDVGVTLREPGGAADVRITLFDQITERTITWLQSSRYTARAANIGRTRTRGVEVEARADLAAGLGVFAGVTHQSARDRGPDPAYRGKELPYLPATEAHVRLTLARGGWAPAVEVAQASSNPRDRYNQPQQRAPARTVLNLALARTWRAGADRALTLTGEVVNLTDSDVYDVEGYPLPGRSLRVSLHWR